MADREFIDGGIDFNPYSEEYERRRQLELEHAQMRSTLELIAAPRRPDGTYNRSREACEILAREALERLK